MDTALFKYNCIVATASPERARSVSEALALSLGQIHIVHDVAGVLTALDAGVVHFVVAEAALPGGGAIALFDTLAGRAETRRIPIVVNVSSADRSQAAALAKRTFAAVVVDDIQPKAFLLKIMDVMGRKYHGSPYAERLDGTGINQAGKWAAPATIVGREGRHLVVAAYGRMAPGSRHEFIIAGETRQSLILQPVASLRTPKFWLNVCQRVLGDASDGVTLEGALKLHQLKLTRGGIKEGVPPLRQRRIVAVIADPRLQIKMRRVFEARGLAVVCVRSLMDAIPLLNGAERVGGVFANEILLDPNKGAFLKVFNKMPLSLQPCLIVGMKGAPPPSSRNVLFAQKPFTFGDLAEMFESALVATDYGKEGYWDLEPPHDRVKGALYAAMQVRIIDEQGVIVSMPFDPMPLAKGRLKNPLLTALVGLGSEFSAVKSMVANQNGTLFDVRAQTHAINQNRLGFLRKSMPVVERTIARHRRAQSDVSEGRTAYDVQVINAFIQATNELMECYTGDLPEMGSAAAHRSDSQDVRSFDIAAYGRIHSSIFNGYAGLLCDRNVIVRLGKAVAGLPRSKLERDPDAVAPVMTEWADQVFGKARFILEAMGYLFELNVAEVGERPPLTGVPAEAPIVTVPFKTSDGAVRLEIMFHHQMAVAS